MDDRTVNSALGAVIRRGGVAPTALLRQRGLDRATIEALVSTGRLRRLRKGWFSVAEASREVVDATRCGGALACVSALRQHGIWTVPTSTLHAVIPSGATAPGEMVSHRAEPGQPMDFCIEPIRDAIGRALRCLPFDEAVAAVDSALRLSGSLGWWFSRQDLVAVVAKLPRRYRRILDWVDPRAGSGLESIVRVRLRSIGIRTRPQVRVDHVGDVDLVVGDRLVIETDGKEHHLGAQFARDRHRDAELLRRGYLVLRLTWADVLFDWPRIEALILEVIRRGDHRGEVRRSAWIGDGSTAAAAGMSPRRTTPD